MLEKALKKYFGYETFRPNQKEIIESLLQGHDTFGILPTGTGKSLCYQLMGYLTPGLVVVISPLISLMEDQVRSLQKNGEKKVTALNSTLNSFEKQYVLDYLAYYKFLFISPEMLQQPAVLAALKQTKLALLVVDEAHCISQWGIDFRPEYRNIQQAKQILGNPLTLALTATATEEVEEDIKQQLLHPTHAIFRESANRKNIALFVKETTNKKVTLQALLPKIAGATIIYCATRKQVEELYQLLKEQYTVAYYHGGLNYQQRSMLQYQFQSGKLQFLIATNAFGMGIDKKDVRYVIHYDLSDTIENYLQEIGRAGRDQLQSYAILLYQAGDEKVHYYFQQMNRENRQMLEMKLADDQIELSDDLSKKWHQQALLEGSEVFLKTLKENESLKASKLKQMLDYVTCSTCRRQYLMNCLGEIVEEEANCCDYHQANLPDMPIKEKKNEKNLENWQKILKKMFSD
ncbi:MAG: ATP-dependent DNA helicase RecQ [Enterococcus sp.]|nr:ATP-dependent DNA helicase RecQ [Enterococcus sp.]